MFVFWETLERMLLCLWHTSEYGHCQGLHFWHFFNIFITPNTCTTGVRLSKELEGHQKQRPCQCPSSQIVKMCGTNQHYEASCHSSFNVALCGCQHYDMHMVLANSV